MKSRGTGVAAYRAAAGCRGQRGVVKRGCRLAGCRQLAKRRLPRPVLVRQGVEHAVFYKEHLRSTTFRQRSSGFPVAAQQDLLQSIGLIVQHKTSS